LLVLERNVVECTVGLGKSNTELIFLIEIDIRSFEIVRPTYSTTGRPNLHFDALRKMFLSLNLLKTVSRRSRNCSSPVAKTIQSSKYISHMR
jgi:hypothetical protein